MSAVLLALSCTATVASEAPLQVFVSKDQQSLVVYDGDTVVATSRVSTGKAGHSTPTGIFSILEKRRHHHSNIYSNAPMPYMQRLTWSGIALHASKHVPSYPASHGCVRLPTAFAADLFKMSKRGLHVLISDRQLVPAAVTHPLLFQPAIMPPEPPALLSDATLRPSIGSGPIEVAMSEAKPAATVPAPVPSPEPPLRILITRSGEREILRDLQLTLNSLGFNPGIADGVAGQMTRDAISAFQTRAGLTADGQITQPLIDAVYKQARRSPPANGQIMVRQNFRPLFEAPVTIESPAAALGTHFFQFQNVDAATGRGEWFGVTLDNHLPSSTRKRLGIETDANLDAFNAAQRALSRISMEPAVRARIEALLAEGSSLTISDTGLGLETGDGTDFITITRKSPA